MPACALGPETAGLSPRVTQDISSKDPQPCPWRGLPTPRVHREPRGVRRRRGLLPHPLKGEAGSQAAGRGRLRAGKALVDTARGTSLRSPLWLYLGSPGPLSPLLLTKEAGRERPLGPQRPTQGKAHLQLGSRPSGRDAG